MQITAFTETCILSNLKHNTNIIVLGISSYYPQKYMSGTPVKCQKHWGFAPWPPPRGSAPGPPPGAPPLNPPQNEMTPLLILLCVKKIWTTQRVCTKSLTNWHTHTKHAAIRSFLTEDLNRNDNIFFFLNSTLRFLKWLKFVQFFQPRGII